MAKSRSGVRYGCPGVTTFSRPFFVADCEVQVADSRPRVVFAIGSLARGGSERQLMQLIETAHPSLLEATVLVYSGDCDPGHANILRELGVELIQVAPIGGPRALRPAV